MPPGRAPARLFRLHRLGALASLLALLSCGGDGPVGPPDPRPTTLVPKAGNGQAGVVGQALPTDPAVELRDQSGDPMAGVTVTWSAVDGSVSPETSTTNASGVASTSWTLGTSAGPQALEAQVSGLVPATFGATAAPGPVASLTLAPDTLRFASLAASDTVEVAGEDAYGNPAGHPTWTSRDPAVATVDSAGAVTAAGNGATWVVADAGPARDSVRVEVSQAVASVALTPVADTINAIGGTVVLDAAALDAGGSPVAGVSIGITSLDPGVATVDGGGTVTSVATGTASIVAAFGALADTARIHSRQVAASLTAIPDVEIGLAPGDTLRILVSAQDSNGVDIPSSAAVITTGDASVADVAGDLLTAGSGEGATGLTVELDGLQFTTDVTVSSAGFDRSWQGGQAGAESEWSSPYNWWPAGYPGALDSLQVGPTPNDPVVAAPDTAATLTVLSGAAVDLGGFTLRLTDDVDAAGAVSNGTLEMVGADATACGTLASLLLVAAAPGGPQPVVTLACDVTVNGTVRSIGGRIVDPGYTLRVQP